MMFAQDLFTAEVSWSQSFLQDDEKFGKSNSTTHRTWTPFCKPNLMTRLDYQNRGAILLKVQVVSRAKCDRVCRHGGCLPLSANSHCLHMAERCLPLTHLVGSFSTDNASDHRDACVLAISRISIVRPDSNSMSLAGLEELTIFRYMSHMTTSRILFPRPPCGCPLHAKRCFRISCSMSIQQERVSDRICAFLTGPKSIPSPFARYGHD
jgi:hypothetical protein